MTARCQGFCLQVDSLANLGTRREDSRRSPDVRRLQRMGHAERVGWLVDLRHFDTDRRVEPFRDQGTVTPVAAVWFFVAKQNRLDAVGQLM